MIERKGRLQRRCDATRDEALSREQTRQESSLQPLVLEPNPSNASVAPFVDFQRLSSEPPSRRCWTTPASALVLALKRSRPAKMGRLEFAWRPARNDAIASPTAMRISSWWTRFAQRRDESVCAPLLGAPMNRNARSVV